MSDTPEVLQNSQDLANRDGRGRTENSSIRGNGYDQEPFILADGDTVPLAPDDAPDPIYPYPTKNVDWAKVKRPGWLQSQADLPADAPRILKLIIGHAGSLTELNEDLAAAGFKKCGSWLKVTSVLVTAFKHWGRHSTEEIAEALIVVLPCNRFIHDTPGDLCLAIERAIDRAREPKAQPGDTRWPGGSHNETGKPQQRHPQQYRGTQACRNNLHMG
jgi:hypothetical protein